MRFYGIFLIILAVVALVTLFIPVLPLFLAMTGIGIPLALALWATPAVAAVLILARLVEIGLLDSRFPHGRGLMNWLGSAVLVAVALAALAALDRVAQEAAIRTLRAEDREALVPPLAGDRIAVRSDDPAAICNDLCRRLLLTGTATAVLLQKVEDSALPPDPATDAVSFSLEARTVCPAPALGREDGPLLEIRSASGSTDARPPSSMVLIRARIAEGTCLIDAPAKLGTADVVLSRLTLRRLQPGNRTGFLPGTSLIGADRLTVHQRDGTGFVEIWRKTQGKAWAIWPIAVPAPTFGYGLDIGTGLGRRQIVFNSDDRFYSGPDWAGFLTVTLGLALTPDGPGRAATREAITAVLLRPGPVGNSDQKLIEGYLDEVGTELILSGQGEMSPTSILEDRQLYLRIVTDDRVDLTYAASRALPPPDLLTETERSELARSAFDRIWRADPGVPSRAEHAGNILAGLPAETLVAFREELFRLAEDRQRRWWSWRLLMRLAEFGEAGAEQLVFLVGDARREGWDQTGNGWQHPYIGGLAGLCRMGPAAATQRAGIDALIQGGVLQIANSSYGQLTANMLIAVGYSPEDVLALRLQAERPMDEKHLRREIDRALAKPDCSY